MDAERIAYALKRKGKFKINNATVVGSYEYVDSLKFFTQGISNRDNARWKRAQYLIVTDCPVASVKNCLSGFKEFCETCQYIIFSQTDLVFDGRGKQYTFNEFLNSI